MTGYVRVQCANCLSVQRVKVSFPNADEGFTPKDVTCDKCNARFTVFDSHIYTKDGIIKQGGM